MKKTAYTSPASASVRLRTEGIMAMSFHDKTDTDIADTEENGGGQWGNDRCNDDVSNMWKYMDE